MTQEKEKFNMECGKCGRNSMIVHLNEDCPFCKPQNNYASLDERWEVEFNRGFADARDKSINMKLRKGLRVEDIKSFFRTLLHTALKERAGQILEKMPKEIAGNEYNSNEYECGYTRGLSECKEVVRKFI